VSKKKKKGKGGIVFSTDPEFEYQNDTFGELLKETLPPEQQNLRVLLEKKGRGGKQVTIVSNFEGKSSDLEDLGKNLKNKCGVGGSSKEGEILLQGDVREKVVELLIKAGYKNTKKSGG